MYVELNSRGLQADWLSWLPRLVVLAPCSPLKNIKALFLNYAIATASLLGNHVLLNQCYCDSYSIPTSVTFVTDTDD